MKKNPIQTSETREKLKNAFWELYAHKKIEHITIKDITDKAGYNRGTFYVYYRDVYHVLEQIEEEMIALANEHAGKLLALASQGGTTTDSLLYIIRLFEKNEKYLTILLGEKGDPSFVYKLKEAIKETFIRNFGTGNLKDQNIIDYIFEYIASAQIGLISYWYKHNKDKTIEELLSLTHNMMFKGALSLLTETKK